MKIFELNTFCGGSTGRIAVDIADYAAKQGAQTVLGFGAGNVSPQTEAYALRVGGKPGRKWHAALRKLLDAEGYGSVWATHQLIGFLKQYQPDVIHLHNLHGCYINHRLLFHYLQKANVPVLWTLHDCWAFTGHCAYFDRVGCERWKTECHDCPQKHAYPESVGLDGSRRNYRRKRALFTSLPNLTLVAPCGWLTERLADSYLAGLPVRVVYNGVDLNRFKPTASELRERYTLGKKRLVLAVASEWEERKGFAYLPQLARRLGDRYKLAVIGLSQAQTDALGGMALSIPRTESAEELAAWYSAADCFVNPTLEDNMPMVNLEALACGTPVVSFDTGGCAEAITPACGIVVPKGNIEALVAAIQKLALQKEQLQNACLLQAERFSAECSAAGYWELYQEATR